MLCSIARQWVYHFSFRGLSCPVEEVVDKAGRRNYSPVQPISLHRGNLVDFLEVVYVSQLAYLHLRDSPVTPPLLFLHY